jgi:hypothetical protein
VYVAALQIGERTAAEMEQCKAWWDEQTAAKAQQKQQEQEEKYELAATIRWGAQPTVQHSALGSCKPADVHVLCDALDCPGNRV